MPVLWEKINYLYGMCYPNYVDAYGGMNMVSPITTLTIGKLYSDTPGYLSSVNLSIPDNSTWEIEDNLQLPHYCQIAVEYVYIGKYLPNAKGKHFELNWLSDKSGDGSGTFPVKGNQSVVGINPDRSPGKKGGGNEWIDKKTFRQELKESLSDAWKKSIGLD